MTAQVHPCESADEQLFRKYCRPINISKHTPMNIALPLYGFVMPAAIIFDIVTALILFLVFVAKKSVRTTINCVLVIFGTIELMTGLSAMPWTIYYYYLKGYKEAIQYGLPDFWCRAHPFFNTVPSTFHTASIWLMCYLVLLYHGAVYKAIDRTYTGPNICRSISLSLVFCLLAILLKLPEVFASYNVLMTAHVDATWLDGQFLCIRRFSAWLKQIGPSHFFQANFWFQTLFVYAMPCSICILIAALQIRFVCYKAQHLAAGAVRKLRTETKLLTFSVVLFLLTEIPAVIMYIVHLLNVLKALTVDRDAMVMLASVTVIRNVALTILYPIRMCVFAKMSVQFHKERSSLRRKNTPGPDVSGNEIELNNSLLIEE